MLSLLVVSIDSSFIGVTMAGLFGVGVGAGLGLGLAGVDQLFGVLVTVM